MELRRGPTLSHDRKQLRQLRDELFFHHLLVAVGDWLPLDLEMYESLIAIEAEESGVSVMLFFLFVEGLQVQV